MTSAERDIATALINCSFLPGSFDKQFVHQLPNWYDREMTPEGRMKMIELLVKYRRQIPQYLKLKGAIIKETDEKNLAERQI